MPGGLLQLVATGAQNELVNGTPSMTHFRSVYRRHTNFALEQIRMPFTTSNLEFNVTQTRTISCRVDRYAQLLHDCYLVLTLPDIWSPLKTITSPPPTGYDLRSNAIGYEFQWIKNIGYNLIDHVDIVMNGQVIQRLRGEWLKLYSYMTHNTDKRAIVDQMREDEIRHGRHAQAAGAAPLPAPVQGIMRLAAKVMTSTAPRI